MEQKDFDKIKTYDDFRHLATNESLSKYEKIGFPNSFRSGKEEAIFADIRAKCPVLEEKGKIVLDIGPGCSELPHMLASLCEKQNHTLLLADSEEMLAHLPDKDFIRKFSGFFPATKPAIAAAFPKVDAIICYSVFHYIFAETDVNGFIDACADLLNDGGQMILGDIPNISKRIRFFSSPNGVAFHKAYMKTDQPPVIPAIQPGDIDDKVLHDIVLRAQKTGCDAYVVPQPADLPMANRRDDIIIRKP